jgi:hypothetical protein
VKWLHRLILLALVAGSLVVVLAVGLRTTPEPHTLAVTEPTASARLRAPIPDNLPAPVDRWMRLMYSSTVPRIEQALVVGRSTVRMAGIAFQGRFRFEHRVGESFTHAFDITLFGQPMVRVREWFSDGRAGVERPFGSFADTPQLNSAANLSLWAEAVYFPAVLVTDTRVRWEAVDEHTALLIVPSVVDADDRILVRFNPATGYPMLLEAMRYRHPNDTNKTLWLFEAQAWADTGQGMALQRGTITWFGDDRPWIELRVDHIAYSALAITP